jgi:hypothetical protein
MSEPNTTRFASPDQPTQTDPSRDDAPALSAPTLANRRWVAAGSGARTLFAWPSALIVVVIIAVIGSGAFAAHQLLNYGTLVPSIAGSWYGPFSATQGDSRHYTNSYNIYVTFVDGHGNQLSATTSSCSAGATALYTQAPTPGITFAGSIHGAHFAMTPQGGDVESDLSWAGTYSTDKIHIDFYVNGVPRPESPYANLRRGTYNDFLSTCRAR